MSQPPNTRSSRPASGTKSFTIGVRLSVRFPRRTVPIWVREPMGLARPLRTAKTPAMNVVLTAPRPTSRMPNLPCAGAISTGAFTGGNYISPGISRGWTRRFVEREPFALAEQAGGAEAGLAQRADDAGRLRHPSGRHHH